MWLSFLETMWLSFLETMWLSFKKTIFYNTMIADGRWLLIPKGLGVTLLIAFCAIIIGSVLGCMFALFKISRKKVLNIIADVRLKLRANKQYDLSDEIRDKLVSLGIEVSD